MTPNNGIDANYIGCLIVTQLYSLLNMNIAPFQGATFVVYELNGGNPVPKVSDKFTLTASLRVLSLETYILLINKIKNIVQMTCLSYGAQATFLQPIVFDRLEGHYRPVINDQKLVLEVKEKIGKSIEGLKI